jgi:hypothetical protein
LPPGMALGWGLTSVRGDRGENHEKWTAGCQKHIKKKTEFVAQFNCNEKIGADLKIFQ